MRERDVVGWIGVRKSIRGACRAKLTRRERIVCRRGLPRNKYGQTRLGRIQSRCKHIFGALAVSGDIPDTLDRGCIGETRLEGVIILRTRPTVQSPEEILKS